MEDLSDKRLAEEFDRLSELKEQCAVSMYEIRQEQARRKDDDIARLQNELDALQ